MRKRPTVAQIRQSILKDLGIDEPATDFEGMAIDMLTDARMEYQAASDYIKTAEREVDKQHGRKLQLLWADRVLKWAKILKLDKRAKPKEKEVEDYFKPKRPRVIRGGSASNKRTA